MSLEKSIQNGSEKRKPFRGAKAVDPSCRNHGGCPHCAANRTFKNKKREPIDVMTTVGTIKQFSAKELSRTIGELSEHDFLFGGRIGNILSDRGLETDSINYNENLLDWLEKTLD